MIRLLVRGLWRLFGRRLGWMAIATAVRTLLRRGSSKRVDDAAIELEERLPAPVRSAIETLPGDPLRRGGQVVAAGRSARQVAVGASRATRAADEGRRRLLRGVDRATAAVEGRPRPAAAGRALSRRLGGEIATETERSRRELTADMLANSRGRAAADDALLDRRAPARPGRSTDGLDEFDVELRELEAAVDVPDPVSTGRRRAPRRRREALVPRVQRSYRRPQRPWDR